MRRLRVLSMTGDAVFRFVALAGFIGTVAIALPHRIRAAAAGDTLDRRQEGVFVMVALRAAGLVLWIGALAYVISPSSMAWSSVPLPAWLRWTGAGLWLIAAGLLQWTLNTLGTNLTDTVVTRRVHTLVTRGPYHWVRHPFYDSVALAILALALVAANWFLLLMGATCLSFLVTRTRTEEAKLLARFGEPYQAYLNRTGRFIPRRHGSS